MKPMFSDQTQAAIVADVAGIALSFVSILLVVFALRQTNKSLKVAKESNEIAQESMRHQSRAYMVVDQFYWNGNPHDGFQFGAMWKNAGNSSTVKLRTCAAYALRATPLPPDFDFPTESQFVCAGNAGPTAKPFMGPGVPRHSSISLADIQAVMAKEKFLYIWGWARYFDVFDNAKEHVTKFCVEPRQEITPNGQVVFAFPVYDRHNCSDEGCD